MDSKAARQTPERWERQAAMLRDGEAGTVELKSDDTGVSEVGLADIAEKLDVMIALLKKLV